MINYYFLEYFRKLAGINLKEMAEACGRTGDNGRKYYSNALDKHSDLSDESVKAIASRLGISEEWITQSPVIMNKADLDQYIDEYLAECPTPLLNKTDKPNQYSIISYDAAEALREFSEKKNEISRRVVPGSLGLNNKAILDETINLVKTSFRFDPDYVSMPLRTMVGYANSHYDSIPAFVKSFASQHADIITKPKAEMLIRDLVMAQSIPSLTVDRKIFDCFASFANITMDQATCDFRLSSFESVFNLFLAVSVTISPWIIGNDDDQILTLTNPRYLPSAGRSESSSQVSGYFD